MLEALQNVSPQPSPSRHLRNLHAQFSHKLLVHYFEFPSENLPIKSNLFGSQSHFGIFLINICTGKS